MKSLLLIFLAAFFLSSTPAWSFDLKSCAQKLWSYATKTKVERALTIDSADSAARFQSLSGPITELASLIFSFENTHAEDPESTVLLRVVVSKDRELEKVLEDAKYTAEEKEQVKKLVSLKLRELRAQDEQSLNINMGQELDSREEESLTLVTGKYNLDLNDNIAIDSHTGTSDLATYSMGIHLDRDTLQAKVTDRKSGLIHSLGHGNIVQVKYLNSEKQFLVVKQEYENGRSLLNFEFFDADSLQNLRDFKIKHSRKRAKQKDLGNVSFMDPDHLLLTEDGYALTSLDQEANIELYNLKTGKKVRTLEKGHWINNLKLSPDGKALMDENNRFIWDLRDKSKSFFRLRPIDIKVVTNLHNSDENHSLIDAAIDTTRWRLYTVDREKTNSNFQSEIRVNVWDIATRAFLKKIEIGPSSFGHKIQVNADGKILISTSLPHMPDITGDEPLEFVHIFNPDFTEDAKFTIPKLALPILTQVSPNGAWVAVVFAEPKLTPSNKWWYENYLHIWHLPSKQSRESVTLPKMSFEPLSSHYSPATLTWSPDSQYINIKSQGRLLTYHWSKSP